MKYRIDVYQNGTIVITRSTNDKAEAEQAYERYAEWAHRYTQLHIDGIPCTTAYAQAYFGAKGHRGQKYNKLKVR